MSPNFSNKDFISLAEYDNFAIFNFVNNNKNNNKKIQNAYNIILWHYIQA